MTINKWGGLASFFLSVSFVVAPLIYLTGNLGDALGIFAYNLADFLYGPILSASLKQLIATVEIRIVPTVINNSHASYRVVKIATRW